MIGENIGSGSSGLVFKGHWKFKNRDVAIKLMAYDEVIAKEVSHTDTCYVHDLGKLRNIHFVLCRLASCLS